MDKNFKNVGYFLIILAKNRHLTALSGNQAGSKHIQRNLYIIESAQIELTLKTKPKLTLNNLFGRSTAKESLFHTLQIQSKGEEGEEGEEGKEGGREAWNQTVH